MKKTIFTSIFLLILGIIIGTKINNTQNSLANVFSEGKTYYFIQEGVYTSKQIMEENVNNINVKLIEHNNDKYHVYLGITKEESIAKRIKNIYEEEGYQLYIKEIKISNEEFDNNITQFDLLINSASSKEEILTIEEVVLANYEEIIKKS